MSSDQLTSERATVVVGLDFGTTFSGFAYCLISNPEKVHKFYEWPDCGEAGATTYCKTRTSLLYKPGIRPKSYVLEGWGHTASVKLPKEDHSDGQFVEGFKLHIAGRGNGPSTARKLPEGITPARAISDYLREMSILILSEVRQNLGNYISLQDVQWCLTVPAIWNEKSKQTMKTCAEMAGMVKGPACHVKEASPHPLIIVLEPEAASVYCQRNTEPSCSFEKGDVFLVVDVGGGTVDLVLHEKVGSSSSVMVKEIAPSSGGLCGGTFVDQRFCHFMSEKIPCFTEFIQEQHSSFLRLKGLWETHKCTFDGSMDLPIDLELPARLASKWEMSSGGSHPTSGSYDSIEISLEDMKDIFDPVIENILELIEEKWIPNIKAMMVVGGFSSSPYLLKRIRERFLSRVGAITVPKEPGSAICCGAVYYGVYGPDIILSRISRKTYGIACSRSFRIGDPVAKMIQDDDGNALCRDVFSVFTRRGEEVPLDHQVCHTFWPVNRRTREVSITLYSTTKENPEYVTDAGVHKEGKLRFACPNALELRERPMIEVSLFFGRTTIEVTAVGMNFSGEKLKMPQTVHFEKRFSDRDTQNVVENMSTLSVVI